ncbi:type IV secretory system conjugative DNA transfer family protein [Sinimarinibacterium sp. NLF-5-8]|uniref:type IV secretory system conjugative DNA transfer family protein n=1 Tax=Sinimarinibacterium sp. NLF-5-8 TaxID=2698684 RepID=UPI00137C04A4|nr:type IV secretion system DNA-binding domain-containing protein [Sinimarinibacterium sp. NLF-5-8]QHS08989.1 type IV secretion system DNA-binding domain-containing protein [Sinimarinibacterium sp. NLF-5-8]
MSAKRKRKLLGATDGWALMGLAGAAAVAHPGLAGSNFTLTAMACGVAALSGFALGLGRYKQKLDPVDDSVFEGFVLPSDAPVDCKDEDGVLLGYTTDTQTPVRVPYNLLTRHIALVGASGVGKTTLGMFMIWQQIERGGGVTFIDAKIDGDSLAALTHMAKVTGRESDFYVLDISNPGRSHTYNPLINGDPDEVSSRLLNLIPSAENNPGADHYRQSVNHALTVIVGALQAANRLYTFNDLTILLQSPLALQELLRLCPQGPERMALDVFLDKYRKPAGKDSKEMVIDIAKMKDTLGGMAGRLALFAQGKFGEIFNTYTPEVDLFDVITQGKILYIRLPTMAKETAAINFAKMLLSDFRSAVARVQALPTSGRPHPPHLLFADEMGSYAMPGVSRLFEQARSAGISVMPGFQAFGQLREVSPEFADVILQNTWSKVLFRFGGADSAETAAEIIGKHKKMLYTLSQTANRSASSPFIHATPQLSQGEGDGLGESWRENEEYRVSPAKLSALAIGECVVTIGPRVYHLKVPYLNLPGAQDVEFIPLRHVRTVPQGWTGHDLGSRYTDFMSG